MAAGASGGKTFLKGLLGFSVLPWASFVVGFVSLTVATRVFPPAELGRITMFTAYGTLLASVCYLGLDQAFVRFYHEPPSSRTQRYLFTTCLLPAVLVFVAFSGIVLVFWQCVSILLVGEPDFFIAVCLCVYAFATLIVRFLNVLYRVQNNPKWYTIQGLFVSVSSTTVYLLAGFFSASHRPAILLMTVSTMVWAMVFIVVQRKNLDVRPNRPDKQYVKTLAGFALPLVPIAI